jgi:intracellular septation protein A
VFDEPAEEAMSVASEPVELPSLARLAVRAIPQVLEGAIIPAALFLSAKSVAGIGAAIVVAFAWWLAVAARRLRKDRRIPAIVLVGGLTLLVRSVLGLVTGSAFLYFFQPSIAAAFVAVAFLGSVALGRPLARRFAGDFCVLPGHLLGDLRVHRFFQRVSLMWAAVGFANAALTMWLLVTLSTGTFVVAQTTVSLGVTIVAVGVSFLWFRQSLSRHGYLVGIT